MAITKSAGFGIVTVMNVKVYAGPTAEVLATWSTKLPSAIYSEIVGTAGTATTPLCTLDHLQTSNLTADGPDMTIQGGQHKNPLIKYGKTCRCEITDALGQKDALMAIGGAQEDDGHNISITDHFPGPLTIVGDIFVIDQKTGNKVPAKIIMYQFLPDAIPSLAFDMNNAATFDLNGDLLSTDIMLNAAAAEPAVNAVVGSAFYSILDVWSD